MSETATTTECDPEEVAAAAVAAAERVASCGADVAPAVGAAEVVLAALSSMGDIDPTTLSSEDLLTFTGLLGNAGRLIEGRQVANVGDIARRSDTQSGMDGLAATHGASSPAGLFEKITGVKASTARRYVQVATHTTPRATDTGLPLPPVFSQTGEALSEGLIGLDAADVMSRDIVLLCRETSFS